MTSHVYTRFFGYDPDRSAWEWMPTDIRDLPLEPAIPIGAGDVEHLQLGASSGKSCRPSRSHRERTLARGR